MLNKIVKDKDGYEYDILFEHIPKAGFSVATHKGNFVAEAVHDHAEPVSDGEREKLMQRYMSILEKKVDEWMQSKKRLKQYYSY